MMMLLRPCAGPAMRLTISLLILAVSSFAAVVVEKTNYKGWPNSYRISNQQVELILTSDVGPRIMRYAFLGGQNLFWEAPGTLGKTGGSAWQLIGGHRLWVAPESTARTYAPDNSPVQVKTDGPIVHAIQPVEPSTGLQKEILVMLAAEGSSVVVTHRITNRNVWAIDLAPWALTMMAPGGVSMAAFPRRGTHPESLLPTNPLVMWAYTDFSDPRWRLNQKYLILRQDPKNARPQKAGLFNPDTWAGYLLGSDLFLKRYSADPSRQHVDFSCSFETFTNADFLELETLGPLTRLEPEAAVDHTERWSLHRNIKLADWTDAEMDRVVLPLARK